MKYKLYAQRIFSFKWEESVDFYQTQIGLPVRCIIDDAGWAEFDLGGAALAVERQEPGDDEAQELVGRFIGISIEVEDIESTYRELTAKGIDFLLPPEPQPGEGCWRTSRIRMAMS